jgi:tripeptidyl-peptidase-1
MRTIHFTFGIFVASITATSLHHLTHERQVPGAAGWEKRFKLKSDSVLPMRIALAQQNIDAAEEYLLSVSDPTSPQYSQHWTPAAVAQKFAPSKTTIDEVLHWLNQSGIAHARLRRSHSGGDLYFGATVQEAERLLHTTYYGYEHIISRKVHPGCDDYSVPLSIRKHVDFVSPTVHRGHELRRRGFPTFNPINSTSLHYADVDDAPGTSGSRTQGEAGSEVSADPPGCDKLTTPDCLRALYHIPVMKTSNPKNSFGLVEFTWGGYLPDDLDRFFRKFEPKLVGQRPKYEAIDGGYTQTVVNDFPFNGEADLDMEYAMSLTFPLNITNYQVGDPWVLGGMNNFLAAMDNTYCGSLDPAFDSIYPDSHPASDPLPAGYNKSDCGIYEPAKVISVSYAHDEIAFTPSYEKRQCMEYLKLGLQGVTVVFASDDFGTAGTNGSCIGTAGTGNACSGVSGNFNPTFPSTCPYVTSVGGTQLPLNSGVSDREVAFDTLLKDPSNSTTGTQISSGGGFSGVFTVPSYQSRAVQSYLDNQETDLSKIGIKCNSNNGQIMRGFPDVAANAAAHVTAVTGKLLKVYGTSGAAPVFASMVAMINDARLSAGKPTVGFINPVLYANPQVMNDIVVGSNYDCNGQKAFPTAKGWDPVTGLGTPDFNRMLDLFLQLP